MCKDMCLNSSCSNRGGKINNEINDSHIKKHPTPSQTKSVPFQFISQKVL